MLLFLVATCTLLCNLSGCVKEDKASTPSIETEVISAEDGEEDIPDWADTLIWKSHAYDDVATYIIDHDMTDEQIEEWIEKYAEEGPAADIDPAFMVAIDTAIAISNRIAAGEIGYFPPPNGIYGCWHFCTQVYMNCCAWYANGCRDETTWRSQVCHTKLRHCLRKFCWT